MGLGKCFIIGGGPSLIGLDLSRIFCHFTIGVNKALLSYPVDINYMMDMKLYQYLSLQNTSDPVRTKHQRLWKEHHCRKILLHHKRKNLKVNCEMVHRINDRVLSMDYNQGIFGGTNSGFGALMLAIALGYKQIYLLGYDMKCSDGKTHWHEGYANQKIDRQNTKLKKFKGGFEQFSSIIIGQGITVCNLNPDSGLDCFPKMTLEEALKDDTISTKQ